MTPAPIDGPAAQRLAQQELARPEYRNGGETVVQKVLDAVGRFLDRLFGGTGGGSTTAIVVVGVLVLAVVLFAVVRAGRVPGRRRRATADAGDPLAPQCGVDHAARAADLLGRGALSEAMREYLRDAVATLERRGVLAPRPGRTGAAAAREGGLALPAARAELDAAARAFDPVWFGGRPATTADVELARRAADAVRAAPVAAR